MRPWPTGTARISAAFSFKEWRAAPGSYMSATYLKPMLDAGSSRVFNVNEMTRRILAKDAAAAQFFRNKPLNAVVLIKDTVPVNERNGGRHTGTKLYFPFDENNIYQGGRSIFIHDSSLRQAIVGKLGKETVQKELLDEDMRILGVLDRLPSLDPFLMKDVFRLEGIPMNDAYFEVSAEAWQEIETFILQRFEPLVAAAFPDAMSSDDKARQLVEKIWEASDLKALQPLVEAFRLPQGEALEIFAAWKGIIFYSFEYERLQARLVELFKWLMEIKVPFGAKTPEERKEFLVNLEIAKKQLRSEWQVIESIVREYQGAYDKAFKQKTSLTDFLAFLRKSGAAYWDLGNSLGKAGQAIYCWNVIASRFPGHKLPWASMKTVIALLASIFPPDTKPMAKAAW